MDNGTYLLVNFTLGEDVLERNVKLAQVILAKSIMIPADTFQQGYSNDGHFEGDVPFWVEGLGNCGGRLSRITECNYQILNSCQSGPDSNGGVGGVGGAHGVTCSVSIFSCEVSSLWDNGTG